MMTTHPDPYGAPGQLPPPPIPAQVQPVQSFGPQQPSRPPSKTGRAVAIVAGVVLVLVIAAAALLVTRSRSDRDEAREALADVEENAQLEIAEGTAKVEELETELTGLRTQLSDQEEQGTSVQDQITMQLTEIEGLESDLTDARASLDQKQAELDQKQAELEQTQAELADEVANAAEVEAAASAIQAGYSVDPGTIRPPATNFTVTGLRIACDGFTDNDAACPPTGQLVGRFLDDGGQLFFEVADVAKIPIGTMNGFAYGGDTTVTATGSFVCGDQVSETIMRVEASPTRITVDPVLKTLIYDAWQVTWTFSSSKPDNCAAALLTYAGPLEFS